MLGRPGDRTMEVHRASSLSYLACAPRVPSFMLILIGLEAEGRLDLQWRHGISSVVRWNLRPVTFGVEDGGGSFLTVLHRSLTIRFLCARTIS